MRQRLVFWTALNSYRSEKCMRGLPEGAPHPVTTEAWTERRIALWRRFTLPSIIHQSVADWRYVVLLDPELRALTEPRLPNLGDPRVIYCYEDGPALEAIREGVDEIVLALIDGDDMYSRRAGEAMLACPAEWMYFKLGFAYEIFSRAIWYYDTIGTGPFFARRIDPRKMERFDRDKRHPNHKVVIEQHPTELPAGNFCVTLHDANTSSHPAMRYVIKQPADPEAFVRDFGLVKGIE